MHIISLVIKSILEFLRGKMIEMKVYTTFPEGDRYEMATTEENVIANIKELMQVLRTRKINRLHISPNEELQIEYKDAEDSLVNFRIGDSFHDAFR